jgi:cytochrome c551/c552
MKFQLNNLIAGVKAYLRTLGRSIIGKSHKDIAALYDGYEDLLEEYGDLATRFASAQKPTAKKKPTKPKG